MIVARMAGVVCLIAAGVANADQIVQAPHRYRGELVCFLEGVNTWMIGARPTPASALRPSRLRPRLAARVGSRTGTEILSKEEIPGPEPGECASSDLAPPAGSGPGTPVPLDQPSAHLGEPYR